MAKYALQSSNTFSYTFAPSGASGANGHLIVANNNPILNIGGESFTIECWVKPVGNYTSYNSIFAKRTATANANSSYQGYLAASNGFMGFYTGVPTGTDFVAVNARPTPNTWNHLAWVFNQGANVRMYLNGSNVFVSTAVTAITNVDSTFSVGAHNGQASQFFGDISNFRIIKGQAIYSGERFNIPNFPFQLPNNAIGYHAGTTNVAASLTGNVIFLSCNDQYIKSNGNTVINLLSANGDVYPHGVDTKDLQNFSYFYPGNTGYPNVSNSTVLVTNATNSLNLNTADFTIETWFYPTKNTGVILERGYGGIHTNLASYILIWDTPNSTINFAAANANNAAGYAVGGLTGPSGNVGKPTLNTWNHIAVSRTGTTYRGFLNGTLNLTITPNANNPYDAVGRGVTIGGMFANTFASSIPSNTISGYISNMRMIRGNSVYNAAFTAANSQLINVTNTILLTGLTPLFEDISGTHTLAVNGANEIAISGFSPFTANAVANGISNLNMSLYSAGRRLIRVYDKFDGLSNFANMIYRSNAVGRRQGRIYDKFDVSEMVQGMNLFYDKGAYSKGQRQGRIYDKFDGKYNFANMTYTLNAVGRRQGRIYDKFDIGDMVQGMDKMYDDGNYTSGERLGRIYNKQTLLPSALGYFTYPSSNVSITMTYEYWS